MLGVLGFRGRLSIPTLMNSKLPQAKFYYRVRIFGFYAFFCLLGCFTHPKIPRNFSEHSTILGQLCLLFFVVYES